jgi:hypothetical protein
MLYRLPKAELTAIASLPCPVVSQDGPESSIRKFEQDKHNREIIKASKSLRHFFLQKEQKSCNSCLLAESCSFRNKVHGESDKAPSLSEVSLLLSGIYLQIKGNKMADLESAHQVGFHASATAVLNATESIFDDLEHNNGIEWKFFLSDLQAI